MENDHRCAGEPLCVGQQRIGQARHHGRAQGAQQRQRIGVKGGLHGNISAHQAQRHSAHLNLRHLFLQDRPGKYGHKYRRRPVQHRHIRLPGMASGVKEQHDAQKAKKGPAPQSQTALFDFRNQIQLRSVHRDTRNDHADQVPEKDLLKGADLCGAHLHKYLHDGKGQG